jgi:hypothetical protein
MREAGSELCVSILEASRIIFTKRKQYTHKGWTCPSVYVLCFTSKTATRIQIKTATGDLGEMSDILNFGSVHTGSTRCNRIVLSVRDERAGPTTQQGLGIFLLATRSRLSVQLDLSSYPVNKGVFLRRKPDEA